MTRDSGKPIQNWLHIEPMPKRATFRLNRTRIVFFLFGNTFWKTSKWSSWDTQFICQSFGSVSRHTSAAAVLRTVGTQRKRAVEFLRPAASPLRSLAVSFQLTKMKKYRKRWSGRKHAQKDKLANGLFKSFCCWSFALATTHKTWDTLRW